MLLKNRPLLQLLFPSGTARGLAMSSQVVTGLNTLKKGTDPPLRADEEYPEWLWKLTQAPPTLNELKRVSSDDLSFDQLVRLVKLENRDGIRTRNHSRTK